MIHNLKLTAVPAYLALCLMLGGASAEGYWANLFLQLLAIPIIFWSVAAEQKARPSAAARQMNVLVLIAVLAVATQFIPLPAATWPSLPGRESYSAIYGMLRTPVPSLPITMAPHLTLSSAVWLLPALAVLVGITRLGFFKPSRTAWAVIAGTSAGVLLGALQMASGGSEDSPWYLYRINNNGVATGFFANANHMATLLVVSVPFIAALLVSSRKKYSKAQWSAIVVALGGALAVVVLGIMLNRSLAGMGLIIATGVASYVMAKPTGPMPKRVLALLPLLFIATAGLVYSGAVDQDMTADAKSSVVPRQAIFSNSIKAARDFFPVGSGIGTFAEIYPAYENPKAVTRTYINHAHNDYIEIVLEMGLPGAVLLVLFLLWWLTRTLQIWRSDNRDHYACAATIASGAILAHSLVDYPLRTAAIAAVFAACCALMSEPHSLVRPGRRGRVKTKARHLSVDAH